MELRKITAIIRGSVLEKVEERLQEMGVKGISVSLVKGYGEYANLYRSDWMVTHVRVETQLSHRPKRRNSLISH